MVPFAGYEMPLQYSGIIAEHQHARSKAVLFDISHMGQATISGDNGAVLEKLVVADLQGMPVGKMRYTLLTNENGGIIDDLIVIQGGYYISIIVNAARKDVDFARIRSNIGDEIKLEVHEDRALIALQGPMAVHVLSRFAPACRHMMFMTSETLTIGHVKCAVYRSGYTGEDGFELSVNADEAEALAEILVEEPEVIPAGLGARDSLRLEAGLCLYGNDIDETTTPIEAGLAWTISKRRREEGGFPGAEVILRQMAEGPKRKRVGLLIDGKVPARGGAKITDPTGTDIGVVTSGGFGPTIGGPIAMGYVDAVHAEPKTFVNVIVRGKPLPAHVSKLPFVDHRYVH
jgi:aminomethyltransferase